MFNIEMNDVQYSDNVHFFNLFRVEASVEEDEANKSVELTVKNDLNDLMDLKPYANESDVARITSEFTQLKRTVLIANTNRPGKIKSSFYMTAISLILVNAWILASYLNGYLKSANVVTNMFAYNATEIGIAVMGGFGASLFFKNIIFSLFELDSSLKDLQTGKFFDREKSMSSSLISTSDELHNTSKQSSLNATQQEMEHLNKSKFIIL